MANGTTKADLQDTPDQIGDIVGDPLDPASERADLALYRRSIPSLAAMTTATMTIRTM